MQERRRIKRQYLLYYARVSDASTRQQIGNLVDLTTEGIMLVSENPLPTGKIFRLRLELSNDVSDRPFLDVNARSLWCQPDFNPSMHNTGFEIQDLSPEDAEIINRLIETYGFRDH